MNSNSPLVSVIIPTFNSAKFLEECLRSIVNQDYKNKEIIIVDGGSKDQTREIARRFGVKVYDNDLVLAEPGVDLGFKKARGELGVVLAADNILGSEDWLGKMVKPFTDKDIFVSYPQQCPIAADDFWINKYINTFTDPVNHFIYGYAGNTRTFSQIYAVEEPNKDFIIYRFSVENHPILALAQGTMIRKSYQRAKKFQYDDMTPIIDIIQKGYKLAYVPEAHLIHKSIGSLSQFVKKTRWGADNVLEKKSYGYNLREQYVSYQRKLRKYLFLPYALSLVGPVLYSIYHFIIDKETTWIYHPFLSFLTALIICQEIIKIKFLHRMGQIDR